MNWLVYWEIFIYVFDAQVWSSDHLQCLVLNLKVADDTLFSMAWRMLPRVVADRRRQNPASTHTAGEVVSLHRTLFLLLFLVFRMLAFVCTCYCLYIRSCENEISYFEPSTVFNHPSPCLDLNRQLWRSHPWRSVPSTDCWLSVNLNFICFVVVHLFSFN